MESWPVVGRDAELAALDAHVRRGSCVVIVGAAGSGKTRLVDHYLDVSGREAVVLAATSAARSVPLGAFAPALPQELPGAPFDRLQAARTWLAGSASLLAVDDAHLLDPLSAALLQQLSAAAAMPVVATARTDVPCDPAIAALWVDGGAERIALGPLDRSTIAALTREALGGPVTPQTEHAIWDRTRGNPLALHELLMITSQVGALRSVDGIWRLDPDIALPREIAEVIAARLAVLDGPEQDAFELLALGDPLPLTALADIGLAAPCESLERRALIHVVERPDGPWVRPQHPLHGDAVRAAISPIRRVRHLRTLAQLAPRLADSDPVRAARWQLEADVEPDADLLRRAALVARGADPDLSRRFADAAVAQQPTVANLCLVVPAVAAAGDGPGALALLQRAAEVAEQDPDREEVAITAVGWVSPLDEVADAALTLARRLHDEIQDPDLAARVGTALGAAAAVAGHRDAILRPLERVLAASNVAPTTVLAAAADRAMYGLFSGRTDGIGDEFDQLEQLAVQVGDVDYLRLIAAGRSTWCCLVGRLDDAVTQDRRLLAAAIERGDAPGRWMASTWLAVALELSGALDEALAVLVDVEPLLSVAEPYALRYFHPALLATSHLQRGAIEPARQVLDALPPGARDDVRARAWLGRAEVWLAGLDGDLDRAERVALELGGELEASGWMVYAALCLFDAVRLLRPSAVTDTLVELASSADPSAVLLQLMAAHATAASDGDGAALDEVASGWARAGAMLLAAEAAGTASSRHAVAGRPDLSARSAVRAETWLERCASAATPALLGWRSPLTAREREVARLAASGCTSKEIADRLAISVRTVDNHLASAYIKLGITSRHELAAALGLASPAHATDDLTPPTG